MGKVSRIPTIGDYTIFFNSLFFVLYSGRQISMLFSGLRFYFAQVEILIPVHQS